MSKKIIKTTNNKTKNTLSKVKDFISITNNILKKSRLELNDAYNEFKIYIKLENIEFVEPNISSDGQYLLLKGFNVESKSITTLWKINYMENIAEFQTRYKFDIDFIYNSNYLIIENDEKTKIFDIENRNTIKEIDGRYKVIGVSYDNNYIVLDNNNAIKLLDIKNKEIIREFKEYSNVEIAPYSNYLIIENDKKTKIFDIENRKIIKEIKGYFLGFTQDSKGMILYREAEEGESIFDLLFIEIWDIKNFNKIKQFPLYDEHSYELKLDKNRFLISIRENESDCGLTLHIWDIEKKMKKIGTFDWSGELYQISPDGQYLLLEDNNEDTYTLWNLEYGIAVRQFLGNDMPFTHMAAELELTGFQQSYYDNCVSITPGGKYIIDDDMDNCLRAKEIFFGLSSIPEENRTITLWNIENGEIYYEFYGSEFSITQDDKYLLLNVIDEDSYDEIFYKELWDIEAKKQIKVFKNSSLDILANKYLLLHKKGITEFSFLSEIDKYKSLVNYVVFKDGEWIAYTSDGYYNCSENANRHFYFLDKDGNIVDKNHEVYRVKKRKRLINTTTLK